MSSWQEEYHRRVTKALTPEHYEHGFRATEVQTAGSDGGAWSSLTWENPYLLVAVRGACPCGQEAYASADGPEEVADLLRKITEGPGPEGGPT